jgi:SAM-dependent methyltransferase
MTPIRWHQLLARERAHLTPLLARSRRAVHLQCSHGTDTLSLWRLGAREVVGVDFSEAMLALARRMAESLGAPATWHCADVLAPPPELAGTADLVYTGKGALPWIADLGAWARADTGLLGPGGHLYVFEGHPLNWIWEPERAKLRLRADGDYFARAPRVNEGRPGRFLAHTALPGQAPLGALERQWTLGEVVSEVVATGLTLLRLEEHPEHYWPQFPDVAPEALRRLPHTFSLLARRGTA